MNKQAAIHLFLASFGIPAYSVGSVPDDAALPYLTHNMVSGAWLQESSMQVDLWYPAAKQADANAKANEIAGAIGLGGRLLMFDGGAVWVKRGNPFCQSVHQDGVERRYINLDLDFASTD